MKTGTKLTMVIHAYCTTFLHNDFFEGYAMTSISAALRTNPTNASDVNFGQSVTFKTSKSTSLSKYPLPKRMSPAPYWPPNSQSNYSSTPSAERANCMATSQPDTSDLFRFCQQLSGMHPNMTSPLTL
jgi:hypothetical protein